MFFPRIILHCVIDLPEENADIFYFSLSTYCNQCYIEVTQGCIDKLENRKRELTF